MSKLIELAFKLFQEKKPLISSDTGGFYLTESLQA
jgi:hypothetical protein